MNETIVWGGWPPYGATKSELLEAADGLLAKRRSEIVQEEATYEADMADWRATIAERLLALIPQLEAREDLDADLFAHGGVWRQLLPPRKCEHTLPEWERRKRNAIADLPEGMVSNAIRDALGTEPMR